MLKLLSSLLIYLVESVVFGTLTYFMIYILSYKNWRPRTTLIGLCLLWVGFIFNIVYTGLMGWNFTPASDLEAFLDSITFVIAVLSLGLIYIGLNKISK